MTNADRKTQTEKKQIHPRTSNTFTSTLRPASQLLHRFWTFEQVSESEQVPNRVLLESILKLQKVLEILLPSEFSLNLGIALEVAVRKNFWSCSSGFSEAFQDGTQNSLHALWVHPAADCLVFVVC